MRLTASIPGKAPLFNPTILGSGSVAVSTEVLMVDRARIDSLVLSPTLAAIAHLSTRETGWDGRGSLKPSSTAVQRALTLVQSFYKFAGAAGEVMGHSWAHPHVSSNEEGEVVLEWWKNTHKLTIYVGDTSAEFFKVWGPNIATEMDDGLIVGNQFQGLWLWLNA